MMRITSSLLLHRNFISSNGIKFASSSITKCSYSSLNTLRPSFVGSSNIINNIPTRSFSSSISSLSLPEIKVSNLIDSNYLLENNLLDKEVNVKGWIRTIRSQKHFSFIEINDGSSLKSIQVVVDSTIDNYQQIISQLSTGASIEIDGIVKQNTSASSKISTEIHAKSLGIIGLCPAAEYPLQKKKHSLEFLRSIGHLRGRTNTFNALARLRSKISFATHDFFNSKNFVFVQTPLITTSDCEGAGEMFKVTTLPLEDMLKNEYNSTQEKSSNNDKKKENTNTNLFKDDFFGKPTFLTVSGQLSLETYACALNDVYCFGPTFRAEKSQTSRHLAEFHMIEAELAFSTKEEAMDNVESYLKHVVSHLLKNCNDELSFFNQFYNENKLFDRFNLILNNKFPRITYKEAVALLQEEIKKDKKKWMYSDLKYGDDLQSEHERWLAEQHFKSCIFITNYPKTLKPFYMKESEEDSDTVENFDLLVPGVGELVGGSAREEDFEKLKKKIKDFNLNEDSYNWYLDLRKYGTVPHSGYGVGFERLVCYLSGMENIRDAIAFPRYTNYAEF